MTVSEALGLFSGGLRPHPSSKFTGFPCEMLSGSCKKQKTPKDKHLLIGIDFRHVLHS